MNELIIIIIGILGATVTFFVSDHLKQGRVRASATLSLLVSMFFYCYPEVLSPFLTSNIPLVFIGASFIGMVTSRAKGNYFRLALAGCLFSILYLNKDQFFEGYGGALGALAFIALFSTITFSELISKNTKLSSGISTLKKMIFKSGQSE